MPLDQHSPSTERQIQGNLTLNGVSKANKTHVTILAKTYVPNLRVFRQPCPHPRSPADHKVTAGPGGSHSAGPSNPSRSADPRL